MSASTNLATPRKKSRLARQGNPKRSCGKVGKGVRFARGAHASIASPSAERGDSTFEMAQIGDDRSRARADQLFAEIAFGMAAPDKSDGGHARRSGSCYPSR